MKTCRVIFGYEKSLFTNNSDCKKLFLKVQNSGQNNMRIKIKQFNIIRPCFLKFF